MKPPVKINLSSFQIGSQVFAIIVIFKLTCDLNVSPQNSCVENLGLNVEWDLLEVPVS
jgi:hypothetical protein